MYGRIEGGSEAGVPALADQGSRNQVVLAQERAYGCPYFRKIHVVLWRSPGGVVRTLGVAER
jgi:hypothetical protein